LTTSTVVLRTEGLTKSFMGFVAVQDVSFTLHEGHIHAVIGPNGAGKTTFFNVISRALPASSGRIVFDGRDVTTMQAHQVARLGVARTFQATTLFGEATALDNVLVGYRQRTRAGLLDALIRTRRLAREERDAQDAARQALDFVALASHAERRAQDLTQEQQKRLAIALALVAKPRLLLLDEPSAGINAEQTRGLIALVERIAASGVTVLLIEHQMQVVMQLCRRIMVLDYGKKIAEGTPDEIRNAPAVLDAYLGRH
jgi:branched-chain amino acid transport system ATP-binding protein